MDFLDQLLELSAKVAKQRENIQTEEATKTAFVMPFINALGYNVFDPTEVVPEFTADVGTKKGEKVDYALMKDGSPIILFECKWCCSNLDTADISQLYRYFSVVDARIAILTNGIIYRFYTDLEETNKMDKKPFLEFDLLNIDEELVKEVKKISKPAFDLEKLMATASDLKYTKEIKNILSEQINSPSEEFVRFFASQVYAGRLMPDVRAQFTDITKRAFRDFINDQINSRLKSAMTASTIQTDESVDEEEQIPESDKSKIVTTEEEIEGYHIVKSILREVIDPKRVVMRDTINYLGILLDDNNRKPICRLYLNTANKYLALMDVQKKEERFLLESLNDIYKYAEQLKNTLTFYR
ncbi:type I restriction enzyme HsdR N-terminal domain-containing protein [bacterium]|nr:type I restriction enzyme HsdR N-terminal domain-containing protein [bacterium]